MRAKSCSTSAALDVLAAADDDVLDPVGDGEIPVLVEHADVAGAEPALLVDGLGRQGRIRVAGEAVRPAGENLAGLPHTDVASVLVHRPHLDPLHRAAVGVDALLAWRLVRRPGDGGMLGAAVGTDEGDAELVGAFGDGVGDGRPAEPDVAHQLDVLGTEARAVQQAGEEVGRATAGRDLLFHHGVENDGWVPPIDEIERATVHQWAQQAPEHADGVADRGADQGRPVAHGLIAGQLAHLEAKGTVGVHHSLGVGRRPRGVGDQGGRVRIKVDRPFDRVGAAKLVETQHVRRVPPVADHEDPLQVVQPVAHGGQLGQEVALGVATHDHQGAGSALAQDEADLLRSVEVHDRHQRHPEERAGVEGDRSLDPVGQLEHDDVAGPQTVRLQAAGHAERLLVDLPHRAEVRVGRRPDPNGSRRVLKKRVAQETTQRAVVPGPFRHVALRQVRRHRSELGSQVGGRRHQKIA